MADLEDARTIEMLEELGEKIIDANDEKKLHDKIAQVNPKNRE